MTKNHLPFILIAALISTTVSGSDHIILTSRSAEQNNTFAIENETEETLEVIYQFSEEESCRHETVPSPYAMMKNKQSLLWM